MKREYLAIYENGPGNMSGFVPDVLGCASTGHSLEEMRRNLRAALEFHLEAVAEAGIALPYSTMHLPEISENEIAEVLSVALPKVWV